jgi:hypothetical protein
MFHAWWPDETSIMILDEFIIQKKLKENHVWMGIPSPWWMNSPLHIWVCPKPSHRPKF